MISLVAKCFVKDGKVSEFLELAKKMVIETQKEEGCIIYDLHKKESSDNEYAFIEQWETQDHLEAHKVSPHFTTLVPKIAEFADFEVETYFTII